MSGPIIFEGLLGGPGAGSGSGGSGGGGSPTTGNRIVTSADSPFTPGATDVFLLVNTTGGAVTILLPAIGGEQTISITDTQGTFDTNNCTVTPNGANTFLGLAASRVLAAPFHAATYRADPTLAGWFKIG